MRNKLQSVRNDLWNEIASLPDHQLNVKPSEDQWSVSQVVRHLESVDKAFLPEFRKAVQENREHLQTEKSFDFLLDRSKKRKSPLPDPINEPVTKEELINSATQARTQILSFIKEQIEGTRNETKSINHPFFGIINVKQMIELIALHEKRHIEQIKEIKESLLSR